MEIEQVLHVGRLALASGRVYRGVRHSDGQPESDNDHATMITWLACSLASRYYPHLDIGLVAQLAVVHDACEVYAGDEYAIGMTAERKAAKTAREAAAIERIASELPGLPWLARTARLYEAQDTPEARFVHAVDKLCPKITIRVNEDFQVVAEHGITPDEVNEFRKKEAAEMDGYAGDFPDICQLRDQLNDMLAPVWCI